MELTKLNSVALVRRRTMPTEPPPLVGEVVPTFADRNLRSYQKLKVVLVVNWLSTTP
jgi:hypothetical protein